MNSFIIVFMNLGIIAGSIMEKRAVRALRPNEKSAWKSINAKVLPWGILAAGGLLVALAGNIFRGIFTQTHLLILMLLVVVFVIALRLFMFREFKKRDFPPDFVRASSLAGLCQLAALIIGAGGIIYLALPK